MDGLSVAANVIAVLQAANAVVSLCYDFKAALKTVPWALTRTLEAVERICSPEGGQTAGTNYTVRNHLLGSSSCEEALTACSAALRQLDQLLDSKSGSGAGVTRWQAFGQAVSWRFKDREVMEILERLQRCKSTLSLAMATEQWVVIDRIDKSTEASYQALDCVQSKIHA